MSLVFLKCCYRLTWGPPPPALFYFFLVRDFQIVPLGLPSLFKHSLPFACLVQIQMRDRPSSFQWCCPSRLRYLFPWRTYGYLGFLRQGPRFLDLLSPGFHFSPRGLASVILGSRLFIFIRQGRHTLSLLLGFFPPTFPSPISLQGLSHGHGRASPGVRSFSSVPKGLKLLRVLPSSSLSRVRSRCLVSRHFPHLPKHD